MINIWATWCGPCKEEMPFLEQLNKEFVGKHCQIIGICDNTVNNPAAVREAQEILKAKGVTYINLVQTEEIKELLPIPAYPVSYFVDSEGRVVTSPETGANKNAYAPGIEEALKDMK
jgi:thiol-disulfide isomerase/thioredoxin